MTQENLGRTTPRALRVSDELWARVEKWAQAHAVTASEAVRLFIRAGLDTPAPAVGSALLPPLKWMLTSSERKQRHECGAIVLPATRSNGRPWTKGTEHEARMTSVCLGAPCSHAWKSRPGEWALVRIVPGDSYWDTVNLVTSIEGAAELPGGSLGHWVAVPRKELGQLFSELGPRRRAVAVHRPL